MSGWEPAERLAERVRDNLPRPFNTVMPMPEPSLGPAAGAYLESRGLDPSLASRNGWYPSRSAGDNHPRIVIPATASDPGNRFWQARLIPESRSCGPERGLESTIGTGGAIPVPPKRFQSPHAARGDALVLVWGATPRRAVVCEGPMDALAAAGTPGTLGVGLMGATPPTATLEHLWKLTAALPVVLMTDADAPMAMIRVLNFMMTRGRSVLLAHPAPWKDLAEVPADQRDRVITR
jgi:hypothetical protein